VDTKVEPRPIDNAWVALAEKLGKDGRAQMLRVKKEIDAILQAMQKDHVLPEVKIAIFPESKISEIPLIFAEGTQVLKIGFRTLSAQVIRVTFSSVEHNLRHYIETVQQALAEYRPLPSDAPPKNKESEKLEEEIQQVKSVFREFSINSRLDAVVLAMWELTVKKNNPNVKHFSWERIQAVLLGASPRLFPTAREAEHALFQGLEPNPGLLQDLKSGGKLGIGLSVKGRKYVTNKFPGV
jgi:predicted SAM-dependent methyltransferase